MSRPKPTAEDLEEIKRRQAEWKQFRRENLFTQVKLAELLGISRRTVQLIEKGQVNSFPDTLRPFMTLKAKYDHEKVA